MTQATVSADGSNTVDLNPGPLADVDSEILSTCSTETPNIVHTITEISNTRPSFLKIVGDAVHWVNDAGDKTPPTVASAVGHFGISYAITTTTETVTLTIADFTITVTNTQPCSLSTFASLSTVTSLTVSADGSETLDADPRELVIIDALMETCSNEYPTSPSAITTA